MSLQFPIRWLNASTRNPVMTWNSHSEYMDKSAKSLEGASNADYQQTRRVSSWSDPNRDDVRRRRLGGTHARQRRIPCSRVGSMLI